MGTKLLNGLSELIGRSDIIDVRGLGLMIGVELSQKSIRDKIIKSLFTDGLLVLPAGNRSIRIMPPLIIQEDEITKGLSILNEVLTRDRK